MQPQGRRTFLKGVLRGASASALGAWCNARAARAASIDSSLPALGSRPSIGPIDASMKSTVAHVRVEEVLAGNKVHPSLVAEMIEEGLRAITGAASIADSWHHVLHPDDVIGIKFNKVGADSLATTVPFATQLLDTLRKAGFAPDRIMLIEAPDGLAHELKARPQTLGWSGGRISFGSGEEELAAVLQEVTAIINVPFLKTHNIAGMSGCLKNLSHALIRRPARYHQNACAPYVSDILALPQIRRKLRLHIVNALRAVYDAGPEATIENTWAHRGIIISQDPVAADSVGLDLINDRRARLRLRAVGDANGRVPHLQAAAAKGLGTDDQDYITLLQPSVS
jgi:hypothetical protein